MAGDGDWARPRAAGSAAHRVPRPPARAGDTVGRGTCGGAASQPGGADPPRGQCWEPAGTMVPTGSVAARARRSPAPRPGSRGGWNPTGPVSAASPSPPRSTFGSTIGAGERGGGANLGFWGGDAQPQPLAAASLSWGGPSFGTCRELGMGTARGDTSLSRVLYLQWDLCWDLPLPFTGSP